jgi:4-hydroxybenzoate polyprenyltransferase
MVVAITISGVRLSGPQLGASYKLAVLAGSALGGDSELSVEKSKLVFRSSVTGLMVLVISFAFFMIYVKYIYNTQDRDVDAASNVATQTGSALQPAQPLSPSSTVVAPKP